MLLLLALASHLSAATLAGVSLPDAVAVGGADLTLNGIGLREKYYLDIYVAGLYVPSRTPDATSIIESDVPKRIVLQFVYPEIPRERLIASFDEDFGKMKELAALQGSVDQLKSWMPAKVVAGDQLTYDYVPGKGMSMLYNGQTLGTIPGSAFMKVICTIYLGPNPPTAALKKGLLGGGPG